MWEVIKKKDKDNDTVSIKTDDLDSKFVISIVDSKGDTIQSVVADSLIGVAVGVTKDGEHDDSTAAVVVGIHPTSPTDILMMSILDLTKAISKVTDALIERSK